MKTEAFFNSGTVSNLIAEMLVTDLGLETIPTTRRVTVADGIISKYMITVEKDSVFFWDWKVDFPSFFIQQLPFDAVIDFMTTEKKSDML